MSSVLDRPGLEKSPLADLHLLAGELGVENFRRLRKADLIDAILARQTGEETAAEPEEIAEVTSEETAEETDEAADRPRRGRRGGRSRARSRDADTDDVASDDDVAVDDAPAVRDDDVVAEKPRGRGRGRDRDRDREDEGGEDKVAEGVVELLANGSGFVRLAPPEPTDDDVYVSAAQVKRCELVSGDRVSGPVRA